MGAPTSDTLVLLFFLTTHTRVTPYAQRYTRHFLLSSKGALRAVQLTSLLGVNQLYGGFGLVFFIVLHVMM